MILLFKLKCFDNFEGVFVFKFIVNLIIVFEVFGVIWRLMIFVIFVLDFLFLNFKIWVCFLRFFIEVIVKVLLLRVGLVIKVVL